MEKHSNYRLPTNIIVVSQFSIVSCNIKLVSFNALSRHCQLHYKVMWVFREKEVLAVYVS